MKQIKTTLLLILLTFAVTASATTTLFFGSEIGIGFVFIACLAVPTCGISLALLIALKFNNQLRNLSSELYDTALGSAFASDLRCAASQSNATSAKELATELGQAGVTLAAADHRVEQLSDHSLQTYRLNAEIRRAAESLAGYMGDLGNTIEVNKAVDREFSTLLQTVTSLGRQLNMLSVNTAIQSARAGTDMAGFAVVTGEMRRLALQCDAVSNETAEKFKAAFLKNADKTEICEKADRAVKKIQTKSQQSENLAAEVVRGVREQASDISQIQPALARTTLAAQSHATRLERTAAESEEFAAHSERLTGVVLRLQQLVSGSNSGAGTAPSEVQPVAESSPAPGSTVIGQATLNHAPKICTAIPLHVETTQT